MNFVISKNVKTNFVKSEGKNFKNHRKNSMLEFGIYKATEFRNQACDKSKLVDKYIYTRSIC